MSGTSLDGVDAVLADFAGSRPRILASSHLAFDPALRAELLALNCAGANELERAALAGNALARRYAEAIAALNPAGHGELRAIGCHGQTVRHQPGQGYTLQIGNAALLAELTERAAKVLGDGWDIEIAETHHRMKADAPSGTALMLGEAAAHGRGIPLDAERGRDGTGLTRAPGAIGFASLRGGTVAGDHDVLFLGPEERLILSHRAENRMIFARGALAAARFLVGQPAGLYSMRDVVGAL